MARRNPDAWKKALLGGLAVATAVGLVAGALYYSDRILPHIPPKLLPPPARTAVEEPYVSVFFADAEYTKLTPERVARPATTNREEFIRRLIAALIAGPRAADHSPTLPADCALESVFIQNRVAVLNFNDKLKSRRFGSTGELFALNSIYRTVTANVPDIRGVIILVDGRMYQTLAGDGGHIAEGFPLYGELGQYLVPAPKEETP